MKNRHYKRLIFTFFMILTLFISVISITANYPRDLFKENYNNRNENFINPKLASSPLNYSSIILNRSQIYRLFEAINFTVYTSGFPDANSTLMEISFTNGTVKNYTMVSVDTDEFYYGYIPEYNAPLGLHNVSFYIFNETTKLLNAHTTYTNFTIRTNYMVNFNSTEYYIGDILNADLTLVNFSGYNFRWWNITIVDGVNESTQNNLFSLKKNLYHFSFKIANETFSQVNKIYYIKVNITDDNGKTYATYFPFKVLNSNPNIISDSIEFSPETVYRTEDCTISLNVTDIESKPESLAISAILEDPNGNTLPSVSLSHQENITYTGIFSIPADSPSGYYRINITSEDLIGGFSSFLTFLTVKNNPPKIHSYMINGISMNQSISVLYGKDLIFTFNVSDVEGVAFIKVALLDTNNNWYNITRAYKANDTTITIRTVDLISGIWYVYIYVIDSDGAVTNLINDYNMAPQGIRIIPDVISTYQSWIAFAIGLLLGIIGGIGGIYKYFKSKFRESQGITPKKKEVAPKKPITKKKEKRKPPEEKLEKKETKVSELGEEEEREKIPKRKIKRKL